METGCVQTLACSCPLEQQLRILLGASKYRILIRAICLFRFGPRNVVSQLEFDHLLQPNTPANDYWELKLATSQIGSLTENDTYLIFSVNGTTIDTARTLRADLDRVNSFLAPAISSLHLQLNAVPFDFWELLNWLYVSYYWIVLADFGQTAPTIYYENITLAAQLTSANNIFVNQVLFTRYQAYLRNTVLPLLAHIAPKLAQVPPFRDLGGNNTLSFSQDESSFIRGYACVVRRRKPWLNLIVAVIVADYAFLMSAYKLLIFVATKIQTRRRRDGNLRKDAV